MSSDAITSKKGKDELQDTERGSNVSDSNKPVVGILNETPINVSLPAHNNNPPETAAHRRNISWGLNEVMNLGALPPTGRQRSDASSTLSQSMRESVNVSGNPDDAQFHSINLLYQGSNKSTRQTVIELPNNLGIVNPMESEAETYLLRAIEKAESDVGGPGSSVFSHVPDAAVQAMDHKMSDASSSATNNDSVQPNSKEPPSWGSNSGGGVSSTRAGFRHGVSVRNFSSPVPTGRHQHRRKLTLDEQLFGLTNAMDAIHAESILPYEEEMPAPSSFGSQQSLRLRANTWESSMGGVSPVVPEGNEEDEGGDTQHTSSYETFAQNANMYFEQAQPAGTRSRGGLIHRASQRMFGSTDVDDEDKQVPEGSEETDVERATSSPADAEQENEKDETDWGDPKIRPTIHRGERSDSRRKSRWARARAVIFDEWGVLSDMKNFIRPKQNAIRLFLTSAIFYVAIPSLGAAAILFYLAGNPPYGILANKGNPINGTLMNTVGEEVDPNGTSISYYLIFAGVRQVVTLTLAMGTQLFLIDFLAIDRGYLFKLGSRLPLFIMQARGWPFVLFFWSIYDWALLAGSKPFFSHWLYFQNLIDLFNGSNPDGNIIASDWNHRILALATGVSFAVAVKRFWMGIFLGRQTYHRYSDKLATLMQKMLLISQVAGLSRQVISPQGRASLYKREETITAVLTEDQMGGLMDNADDNSEVGSRTHEDSVGITTGTATDTKGALVIDPDDRSPLTGKLTNIQKNRITRLLGAWEEPTEETKSTETPSIASLMHFRRALSHLRTELPFSASFGAAGSREDCVASSQEVFRRLMTLSDYDDVLNFEVLALLGAKIDGNLDQNKLMELIKLFRPDRDGSLSILHFVRSVDKVYKDIRMLRASVNNSTKVDGQFETIFNLIFYVVIIVIILNTFGLDPLALFVSISGLVLGFAFMIGTASSKYFEGLLFILVRRPYGIGDCIHVSDPNSDTSYTGSAFWYVEDITLFSTQVRYFYTNERASLSNGSLANSRIINSSRSYNAGVYHYLKLPLDVPYEKVKIFHEALETFVRNRPREWIGLSSFRATTVNANEAYIEYMVCIDHRESWASWTQVRTSQSDLMGFGVELAKKLDIVYRQPTLPIDLNLKQQQAEDLVRQMTSSGNPPPAPPMPGGGGAGTAPIELRGLEQGRLSGHRPSLSDLQTLASQFPSRAPSRKHDD